MKQYKFKEIYELSKTNEVQDIIWDIASKLLSTCNSSNNAPLNISAVARMILAMKINGMDGYYELKPFLSCVFPIEPVLHSIWGTFSADKYMQLDEKVLLAVILGCDGESSMDRYNNVTPSCISDLAIKLLDIKKDSKVADLCCGTGSFLVKAKASQDNAEYYGYDINKYCTLAVDIKASCFNNFVKVKDINIFNIKNIKFDRIFMNHPFGWRLADNNEAINYIEKKIDSPKTCFSDWAFVSKALDLLKDNGKVVTLVSNACLSGGLDRVFREKIVSKGYLEAVISLPSNLFSYTFIPAAMLVLSKKNNKTIKFVDATNLFYKTRRKNSMSDEDITTIYNAILKNGDISATIAKDKIAQSDYSLVPARYIEKGITKYKNGVEFSKVIKSIVRGAPLSSSELDLISSSEETDYQYLMLSNIKNGIIDEELPYIKNIDKKYEKYIIKDKSLLISKNGAPFKIAVAEIKKGQTILANGNLYVIELDQDQVDPYYLQAFFMSESGQQLLKKFVVGATIPNLPVSTLKTAIIPLPSLKVQKRIADEYSSTIDEINILKKKIEKAHDRLSNCFDSGLKGE